MGRKSKAGRQSTDKQDPVGWSDGKKLWTGALVVIVTGSVGVVVTKTINAIDESSVDPITASVSYPRGQCSSWIVPGDLDQYGPAPDPADIVDWARSNGGAQSMPFGSGAGTGMVQVTFTAPTERPVTILSLAIRVENRQDGGLVGAEIANECGGETVARFAEIDLDSTPPRITASAAVPTSYGVGDPDPIQFPYTVSNSTTENLLLITNTFNYVEYTVDVQWSDGEESGTLSIDDRGEPFRTSSEANAIDYAIPAGDQEWLR